MEQIKKVKIAITLGLSSIMETFWAIGASIVARDVLPEKKPEHQKSAYFRAGSVQHKRSPKSAQENVPTVRAHARHEFFIENQKYTLVKS